MSLDATLDIIGALNDVYSRLNVLIIDLSPQTEDERKQLRLLLTKRDELRETIRKALSDGFAADAEKLAKASADIVAAAKDLEKQKDTIETAKTAISAVVKVLGAVAQIISLVA